MASRFPDAETVRRALALANRAPSVHNSQPWRWRVAPNSLHLYAELSRQLPATDPDQRDLIVSCGAGLNHCSVALAALGWQASMHRLPNPAEASHLAAIEVQPYRAQNSTSRWPRRYCVDALIGATTARGCYCVSAGLRSMLPLPSTPRRTLAEAVSWFDPLGVRPKAQKQHPREEFEDVQTVHPYRHRGRSRRIAVLGSGCALGGA